MSPHSPRWVLTTSPSLLHPPPCPQQPAEEQSVGFSQQSQSHEASPQSNKHHSHPGDRPRDGSLCGGHRDTHLARAWPAGEHGAHLLLLLPPQHRVRCPRERKGTIQKSFTLNVPCPTKYAVTAIPYIHLNSSLLLNKDNFKSKMTHSHQGQENGTSKQRGEKRRTGSKGSKNS